MPQRILFHELTREELNARANESIVLLPTGATEQHGPHLPTGTDTYAVEHIVRSAAADGYRFVGGEVGYVMENPSSITRAMPVMGSGTGDMPHTGMSMQRDPYHEHSVSADGYRFMGGDLGYEYEGIPR